jgi:hypothetical protein
MLEGLGGCFVMSVADVPELGPGTLTLLVETLAYGNTAPDIP